MTNVLIVDKKRMARDCIRGYLQSAKDRYSVVAQIANADNAEQICKQEKVDLIIMAVRTEGAEDGIEVTAVLKQLFPHIKVIIITDMTTVDLIDRAKKAGADSFWYKEIGEQDLLSVVDKTVQGESVYPDCTPVIHIGNMRSTQITPAELKVLRLVAKGYSNGEIAEKLCISVPTVRYHLNQIFVKTGYSSRVLLATDLIAQRFFAPR